MAASLMIAGILLASLVDREEGRPGQREQAQEANHRLAVALSDEVPRAQRLVGVAIAEDETAEAGPDGRWPYRQA